MMYSWLPLELFLALNCQDSNSLVVVPLILMIWSLEMRWLWLEDSQANRPEDETVITRGRLVLILYFGFIGDETIMNKAGMSKEVFSLLLCFWGVLAQVFPLRQSHNTAMWVECLIWQILIFTACYLMNSSGYLVYLALQIWVLLFLLPPSRFEQVPVQQDNAPKLPESTATISTNITPMTEATPLLDEDGKLLVQAMASEIIFNVIAQSDLIVSGLCERNGTFRWLSNSVEKIYGYTKEELLGTSGWGTVHPDDIAYLMKVTRDSSNRVRMNFRRRRKDGSYLYVESFGIYSEGFLFFQEFAKKDKDSVPSQAYQDVEEHMKTVVFFAQTLFSNASPITDMQLQDLKWLHEDARGIEPYREDVKLLDCLQEVVSHGTTLRDNLRNTSKTLSQGVRFRASLAIHSEEGKQFVLTTNPRRFIRSLTSLLDAAFAVPTNHEILFEAKVIDVSTQRFAFSVFAERFRPDDLAIAAAKSFAVLSHEGSFHSQPVGTFTQFTLFFDFKNESLTSDTCLLVDDDDTVLTIMKKRITSTWKGLYHEDISVITAKTGQDAIRIAKKHLPKRFVFACVDLNLSENSQYTGEETMRAIKELDCADRVVILTATAPSSKVFETIYMKGSPDLYKDLCRKT